MLTSRRAAGFLLEVWLLDAETELRCRLVARRNQVVRHRTQIKKHSILQAHLIPPCPHADLFGRPGRNWLGRQELPADERGRNRPALRELDRLGEDLAVLDREIAERTIEYPSVKRLLTTTGININVVAGLVAAIGDVRRFSSPQKLVSYVGLNPRVRQSGLGLAQHGRISKAWSQPHARHAGRGGLGCRQSARPTAFVFPTYQGPTWSPDRSGRRGTQARRALLAFAQQGCRLPMGASGAGWQQRWRAGEKRQ